MYNVYLYKYIYLFIFIFFSVNKLIKLLNEINFSLVYTLDYAVNLLILIWYGGGGSA